MLLVVRKARSARCGLSAPPIDSRGTAKHRINASVVEVKKTNRRIPFLYRPGFPRAFALSRSLLASISLVLFSLSPYSRHPRALSRRLPHSRLPLRSVRPLPTIRRTITFRSTTYPLPARHAILFSVRESSSIIDSGNLRKRETFAADSACQV